MQSKESYYAALERQRAGEASVRNRFDEGRGTSELDALESLYTDVGMKAFTAFNNCLEWIGKLGGARSSGGPSEDRIQQALHETLAPAMRELQKEIHSVQERLGRLEGNIAALEAGMRRIDKFTLDAFRKIQEVEEQTHYHMERTTHHSDFPEYRGRLAKEEAASLALDAAKMMKSEGRRLTLAAVAREAGLKYGQIVYAFGNKEGFMEALRSELDQQDREFERTESA